MEGWTLSKCKPLLCWLLMMMVVAIFVIQRTQGGCIEEERIVLLEIKASLLLVSDVAYLLPTWVDHGSTVGGGGSECCDWERVMCNTTTGHVTQLSLDNLRTDDDQYMRHGLDKLWPLNVSLFLHFEELRSLDLSYNFLDNTGFERFLHLKKLEILDLSWNLDIGNEILPSLSALTSLRILDFSGTDMKGNFPANGTYFFPPSFYAYYAHMYVMKMLTSFLSIYAAAFAALENLEMLDLSDCQFNGTFDIQGSTRNVSILKRLKTLNLAGNKFNESIITSLSVLPSLEALDLSYNGLSEPFPAQGSMRNVSILKKLKTLNLAFNNFNQSIITSLSALPSLEALDLRFNMLSGAFPPQELAHLTNLKKLDLSGNGLNHISIQGCNNLSKLKRLESIALGRNDFNKSIILCLSALPSLKILDFHETLFLGSSFSIQELSALRTLETLDMSSCGLHSLAFNELPNLPNLKVLLLGGNNFNGTLPMEALASFYHLEVLDLRYNQFVGSIPSTIEALSSLQVLSLASNQLNGSLPEHGLCELENLYELDLSENMFEGNLPRCFNRLSSLKALDLSSNQFTGILLPSLIANLTSLEYIDFGRNKFEGSFSFSTFSNHTKLEVVRYKSYNENFEVETEEPLGWIPMFQLKFLELSDCNLNLRTRSVIPGFLLHQHELQALDLSHNSLGGKFPTWLVENNKMLRVLILRNNSFDGSIRMPWCKNTNMRWLDLSRNQIIGLDDIGKCFPFISYLNFSGNGLTGAISSSIGDLSSLTQLDLSDNDLSGEVPKQLFSSGTILSVLNLSKNKLHGQVLSGNLSLDGLDTLLLDNNCFTGKIGNETSRYSQLRTLDISNNFFSGVLPSWVGNMNTEGLSTTFLARNNMFEGRFPCGNTSFEFLDISQNSFSGSIPSCLNLTYVRYLHLGSNNFTGSIPLSFRNLTYVWTLDLSNNKLSGRIPKFLGELSYLNILLLRKNNFSGWIPRQLCQLNNVSFLDLSNNFLSGPVPHCLQNIIGPSYRNFKEKAIFPLPLSAYDIYGILGTYIMIDEENWSEKQDEVQFTTKSLSLSYKGDVLGYMIGLDLSCNKLSGKIPEELGLSTQIHALNLSHNQLTGTIPVQFSNLTAIESSDLSSNCLSGKVPSQLIKLNFLSIFSVAHNNLSGKLPEMKGQFNTFTKESYEGNPLLCGPPLEKQCSTRPQITTPSNEEDTEKWYDIDMACFFGSFTSTWVVVLLGFVAVFYVNPYWRRRWFNFIEECMYTCYYFFCDSIRRLSTLFYK